MITSNEIILLFKFCYAWIIVINYRNNSDQDSIIQYYDFAVALVLSNGILLKICNQCSTRLFQISETKFDLQIQIVNLVFYFASKFIRTILSTIYTKVNIYNI